MNLKPVLLGVSAVSVMAALSGCGGSTIVSTDKNPRVRAVDALSTPSSVNVSIDGTAIQGVSTFGSSSQYQVFTNGNRNVIFTNSANGATVINSSPLFRLDSYYTVIGFAGASGPDILVLSDSGDSSSVNASLRFAKVAAGAASAVDVYVTQPGADITNLQPNFAGVTLGSSAVTYAPFASGTYEIRETAAGLKVPLIDQQITLNASTAYTVLDAGGTTYLTLQDQ